MTAYVTRIILLMGIVTSLSFAYELDYSNKAVEITGEIISIRGKAKGKNITVSVINENQVKDILEFSVGPIIDLIGQYDVGNKIPIKYCRECYPAAKMGDVPNIYSLTLMMLVLSSLVFSAFTITWLKGRNA